MKKKIIGTVYLILIVVPILSAQSLNISIRNIKDNDKGVIRVALFRSEEAFTNEKECQSYVYEKTIANNGFLNVKIDIKPGTYGVTVMDDKDNSGIMEYNRLGIPKKGFGFSNFTPKIMRKPKFSNFSFTISECEEKNVEVKMCYLNF